MPIEFGIEAGKNLIGAKKQPLHAGCLHLVLFDLLLFAGFAVALAVAYIELAKTGGDF